MIRFFSGSYRVPVSVIAISLFLVMVGCKPSTSMSSKSPDSDKSSELSTRSSKSGEINGSDDSLLNEEQKAVPPEVLTGHYLTCQPQDANAATKEITIGCAGYEDGRRVKVQGANTKWYVGKDSTRSFDTELKGAIDPRRTYDTILTIAKSMLNDHNFIKAVEADAGKEKVYSMKIASLPDKLTVFRASTSQDQTIDEAGFQLSGSGRFELNYRTGRIRVIPAVRTPVDKSPTAAAVRLYIDSILSDKVVTHEFSWVQSSKENKGSSLPGAGGLLWQNLRPTKKGSVPFSFIGYSNCQICGVMPVPLNMQKQDIEVSISDFALTIDFSLANGQIFAIALDIPLETRSLE